MCYLQTKVNDIRNLVLSWRSQDRRRYAVAELFYNNQGIVEFSYLKGSADWEKATEAGFIKFSGINEETLETDKDILLLLSSRLPPKKRDDYSAFLEQILISPDLKDELNPFQLLAYSAGRSVNDSFEFIDPLTNIENYNAPIIIEVAGTSHAVKNEVLKREDLSVGDGVTLVEDYNNPVDPLAVKIIWDNKEIGFVNKIQAQGVRNLIKQGINSAEIIKVNGTISRPRIVLRLSPPKKL